MVWIFTYFEAVFVVIGLISLIIGLCKGFINQVFRLLAGIGSIIVAFLISDNVGAFLNKTLTFVAAKVGNDFALWIWYAASFLLIWLVLGIILRAIGASLTKSVEFIGLNGLNRFLGGILAVGIVYFILSAVMALISLVPSEGIDIMVKIRTWLDGQITGGCYMKWLSEHNWFGNWLLTLLG